MDSGRFRDSHARLHARRQAVTFAARWISVGSGLLVLGSVLGFATPYGRGALTIVAVYAVFNAWSQWQQRRGAGGRALRFVHDVLDALSVAAVAAFTGGSSSPVALMLYPHVASVAARGGITYALAFGALDAGLMLALSHFGHGHSLATLEALALLACALLGGIASAHLHEMQDQVRLANHELQEANGQLAATVLANETARQEQDAVLGLLRESEERNRRLLERIQDGVLIVRAGRVALVNEEFARLTGEPQEALLGRDFRELAPPEDRAELTRRYEGWQASQQVSGVLESRLCVKGASPRLVSLRAGSLDFEGQRSIVATVRDITRERAMELDLKAHAERLAAINEIANAVNLSLRIDDILLVAADEARRLVPFERLTVALRDEHGPLRLLAAGQVGELKAGFEADDVAWLFRRPATWCEGQGDPAPAHATALLGGERAASLLTLPLFSKDRVIGALNLGRIAPQPFSTWDLAVLEPVARHIAIALDNARLLETVRRRSQEFESLLEISRGILERLELPDLLPVITRSVNGVMNTSSCMLLLREGGRLRLAAHEGLESELAANADHSVGEGLSGWVAAHGLPLFSPDIRKDPRTRQPELAERYGYQAFLCVPLKHGSDVLGTLEVVTREPRDFGPEAQAVMSAFADQAAVAIENARLFESARSNLQQVTEANRRLEELDHLRQQYLRNVSHEFRTPLTVIKGYAEYLADAPPPGEAALKDVMRVMSESCDRVIDMIDTLLELSRVEQGNGPETLQIGPVDLCEVVQNSLDPQRLIADRKGLELRLELPQEPVVLEADSSLLIQVVRKLVDNAIKYSPAGGHVAVRLNRDSSRVHLQVEDVGIGIEAEHLTRIFDKFYMVDGGIARRAGGTGVGLYLVREIVKLHRGSVSVSSTPGAGSLFEVRLPLEYQPVESAASVA